MSYNVPYKEEYSEGWYERVFKNDVETGELVWHRDREDRIVEAIEPTDWMFQRENELPIKIEGQIFIPMGQWHRTIKGTGDLKIRVKKLHGLQ
jgi:hypothetical protein